MMMIMRTASSMYYQERSDEMSGDEHVLRILHVGPRPGDRRFILHQRRVVQLKTLSQN